MRRSRLLGASMLLSVQVCVGASLSVAADKYEVQVQRNVRVPMRDGVHLATDLYIPVQHGKPLAERLPSVLLRTPYNKAVWGTDIVRYFAEHGYLSATQDCRGRFESEGKFFPFVDDPKDGSDTIAWLARHRRCNGKVAMHGPSYMAWVQFHAATRNPPGLATMIPMHGPTNAYHYDPRNTVSSNGRCIIAYGPAAGSGFSGMGPRDQIELETLAGHGRPGKRIADRPDVLVYQTAPLSTHVRAAGNVMVTLCVASDAPDTDFFVKLLDVYPPSSDYPDGYAFPVSEGILRARYRDGFKKPRLMKPGEIYRLRFPLEPTANRFQAGHRIRVDVCSSNFPNFDINPNTGEPGNRHPRVATNTVYHNAGHASFIELPIWATRSND